MITAGDPHRWLGLDASKVNDAPMVTVSVTMDRADAERLAAAGILRGGMGVLAAEAKELGQPVVDALVAAGYGRGR